MRIAQPIMKRWNCVRPFRGAPHGFTLVELLVVIGVVGVLLGILLPVLAGAKAKGEKLVCLNNHRQLMLACLLYVDDFDGRFPYNFGTAETRRTVEQGTYLNWVNNVMTWELDPENTNTMLLTAGGIGRYTSGGISLYRCPEDEVVSDLQRAAGWQQRTRSISMNAMVGNAGEFTAHGTNVNNPNYRQFFLMSEVPEPATIFVLMEEHPDSINDGYFIDRAYPREWNDLPASYHRGAAHLAFADGHVEAHAWVHPSTRSPARPDGAQLPRAVPADEREDFYWLMEHMSLRRLSPNASGYSSSN
jgi:prepilin-type N-terminal cleavage/methylation domain-containing protein/prepilin-type processing-associated H-X9-DG protein